MVSRTDDENEKANQHSESKRQALSTRLSRLPTRDQSLLLDSFSAALADGQLPANDITVAMLMALDRSSRADLASTSAVGEERAPASAGVAASVSAFANRISDFISVDAAAADALGELLEPLTLKR